MRKALSHISLLLLMVTLSLISCGRTPHGVLSKSEMADLIVDLQIADAYIDSHGSEFPNDSSKQVLKQSIFKKHGITCPDYDSSLVWYAHNMEDYIRAHDLALLKLKERYDKLAKNDHQKAPNRLEPELVDRPARGSDLRAGKKHPKALKADASGDTADLWQGQRQYMLTRGARQGFIPFDVQPDSHNKPGDRYQLVYKLTRGNNNFKVCLNVDYTDGSTSQMARNTNLDGWVAIDVQSDTARQVRRIYGYLGYDIRQAGAAYVDSLMLLRTHYDPKNYLYINGQRLLERKK